MQEREAARRALAAAAGERSARRRRLTVVLAPVAAVLMALLMLVGFKAVSDSGPSSGATASAAETAVVNALTNVPAATLDAVGVGTSTQTPQRINGEPLTADGKPRVLYVGAEYCPYCAAERWPMIVALSRFGTWDGLQQTTSAGSPEVYPNTATMTFHGASYTSDYLAFHGIETQTNQVGANGQFTPLDTLSDADAAVMAKHDPSGGIPFVDIGGDWSITGATFLPEVLSGKTHEQIATALADPKSDIARAVDGAANVITAALCTKTGGQPANVCTAPGVVKGREALLGGN